MLSHKWKSDKKNNRNPNHAKNNALEKKKKDRYKNIKTYIIRKKKTHIQYNNHINHQKTNKTKKNKKDVCKNIYSITHNINKQIMTHTES